MYETKLYQVVDSNAGLLLAEYDPRTKKYKEVPEEMQHAAILEVIGLHLHVGDIIELTARIIKRDGLGGCDTCDKLMEPADEETRPTT